MSFNKVGNIKIDDKELETAKKAAFEDMREQFNLKKPKCKRKLKKSSSK